MSSNTHLGVSNDLVSYQRILRAARCYGSYRYVYDFCLVFVLLVHTKQIHTYIHTYTFIFKI